MSIYETCMGDVYDLTEVVGIAVRPIPAQLAQALRAPRAQFAIVLDYGNGRQNAIEPFLTEAAGQIAVKMLSAELYERRITSNAQPPADLVMPTGPVRMPPLNGKN